MNTDVFPEEDSVPVRRLDGDWMWEPVREEDRSTRFGVTAHGYLIDDPDYPMCTTVYLHNGWCIESADDGSETTVYDAARCFDDEDRTNLGLTTDGLASRRYMAGLKSTDETERIEWDVAYQMGVEEAQRIEWQK